MAWTVQEIEQEFLGGQRLELPGDDVLRAFAAAEVVRGRDWVMSHIPADVRFRGHWNLEPVTWFGTRVQALDGAEGREAILQRLKCHDPAAESELTAIYLLRGHQASIELAVEHKQASPDWHRLPDFVIRERGAPWVHVEVTALHTSLAFGQAQGLLGRIAGAVTKVEKPFILEIVLRRDLTAPEEQTIIQCAVDACTSDEGTRKEVGEIGWVLVKTGDVKSIVPSVQPDDGIPRLGSAIAIPGPLGRQVIVRVPFADQRAKAVLTKEARQLPPQECGLVMVDVTGQPSAWESWPTLIPPRFTPTRHTRVRGVLLFWVPMMPTIEGVRRVPVLKLIPNPHVRSALPDWLTDRVEKLLGEYRRLNDQPR